MNGAEALARTLLAAGVEVCFANPGTSEMHSPPRASCSIWRGRKSAGRNLPKAWAWKPCAWQRWRRSPTVFRSACARRGPFLIEFLI